MARVCNRTSLSRAGRRALTCTDLACLALFLAGSPWLSVCADPPRSSQNSANLAGFDALITAEDREHWAFQPVKSPILPEVKNRGVGAQLDRSIRVGRTRRARAGSRAGGGAAGVPAQAIP